MLVDREQPDRAGIFAWAARLTTNGLSLIVFPEGTRSRDGRVAPVQGRQLLPGARSRPARRAALGRRQPSRDVERTARDLSRRRAGWSSTTPIDTHGPGRCATREGVRRARAADHRARRRVRSRIGTARRRCTSRSHLSSRVIVRPGVLWLDGATVVERDRVSMRRSRPPKPRCACNPPAEITAVRTMYKRVGLDPTKTRPSSEALLRRVRKGDPLPRINSMVDVCNWCSLEFQLPYGLYDAAQIDGRRRAAHRARRASRIRASGRTTCMSAAGSRWPMRVGPFGNPTSDSARTMVTTATTQAHARRVRAARGRRRRLDHVLDATASAMDEFTGCREVARSYNATAIVSRPWRFDLGRSRNELRASMDHVKAGGTAHSISI